jgi:hypothetical protein
VRRVKYGFDLNATRDGILINERETDGYRKANLHMVGVEGKSHNAIKARLRPGRYTDPRWGSIGTVHFSGRLCVFDDLYRPHIFER